MEYSIYDAMRAGFGKVILVVRREFVESFWQKFVDRASSRIQIAFAYQDPDAFVPTEYDGPERSKPWGTAHAVLCAKPEVEGAFGVINADDFYGQGSLAAMGRFLASLAPSDQTIAAMVGYRLANTLSDHGTVNRGVCRADSDGWLSDIVETFEIAPTDGRATCRDAGGSIHSLPLDTTVSMNLWGFPAVMMEHLESGFASFLASSPDSSTEYELPTFTKHLINQHSLRVRVLATDDRWCGMTYQEDLPMAQARIAALVEEGIYPSKLW